MVDAVIFLIYGLTWCIGVTTIMITITITKNATTTALRKIEIIYKVLCYCISRWACPWWSYAYIALFIGPGNYSKFGKNPKEQQLFFKPSVSLLVLKDSFYLSIDWYVCAAKRDRIRIKRRHGSKIEPNCLSTRGNCPSFIIERAKTICCWVVDWKELLKKYITKNDWDYEVTEKASYQTNHCRNIWSPDVTCLEDKWFLYIPIN